MDPGGAVGARGMEEGGVEERRVTLGERQLDVVGLEVLTELRPVKGQVPGQVLLRVRQVHRRPGLDRHVRVRDRALQGEHGRQPVHMGREPGGLRAGLEAQMVVAVRGLRRAARVDDVDLGGDLVAGAEPGVAHGRDDVVGVVGNEDVRRAQRQLLQRVPDPVVLPGLGEMVARGAACRALAGDDRLELLRGAFDDAEVVERAGEHHDAGAVVQRAGQLGLGIPPPFRA